MDTFEANASDDLFGNETLGRIGIDIGLGIQELDDADGGTAGGRDVGDKHEDISSLDSTKSHALMKRDSVKGVASVEINMLTINDTKKANIPNSRWETNIEPYQKIKAMTQKPIDCESE